MAWLHAESSNGYQLVLQSISLADKFFYHNILSILMVFSWIYVFYKGHYLTNDTLTRKISIYIVLGCLIQELIDFMNRMFLDPNYFFSIQRDLPLLQFCQIAFYFSLLCIFRTHKKIGINEKYSVNQFLFDCAFLLGFSGAFQGVITPDFDNINNLLGVICIQLQHSLIILCLVWLIAAYGYRLRFVGVCMTYLLINLIAPIALYFNSFLGQNAMGVHANYFYVNELPKADNFFLNLISEYPSPDYILYIQPIFIAYFLSLYLPFFIYYKVRS